MKIFIAKPLRILSLALVLGIFSFASAHERYFTFVYDWFTPHEHEREVELHWTQFEGGPAELYVELEYGITDRWVVAPYILFEYEDDDFHSTGYKVETRYRFNDFEYQKFLPALYLELKKKNDDDEYELEGKIITTYVVDDELLFSGNLVMEKELAPNAVVEWGYAAGASKKIGEETRVGLEFFGNLTDKEHWIGPNFYHRFNEQTKIIATLGIALDEEDGHRGKIILAYEF